MRGDGKGPKMGWNIIHMMWRTAQLFACSRSKRCDFPPLWPRFRSFTQPNGTLGRGRCAFSVCALRLLCEWELNARCLCGLSLQLRNHPPFPSLALRGNGVICFSICIVSWDLGGTRLVDILDRRLF